MALIAFSKGMSVAVGDVLVYKSFNTLRGARVDDYTYTTVHGMRVKFYGLQHGQIEENKFVASSDDFNFASEKTLGGYGYEHFWTPDKGFKDGQFLKDQNNVVYFHKDSSTVWRTLDPADGEGSTWASLASWRNKGVQFTALKTVADKPFEDIVSGKVSF
jgi:hypothetical protein